MTVFVLLVVVASAIWVGVDAGGRDLTGTAVRSPGGWVAATLLLWIVFFPLYLGQRRIAG